jgi:hypothetical protein
MGTRGRRARNPVTFVQSFDSTDTPNIERRDGHRLAAFLCARTGRNQP